jgi:hypothetical protein
VATHIGALCGALVYTVFIGMHHADEDSSKNENADEPSCVDVKVDDNK